ncbi:MAG: protein TolQ [Spongiibacteraceae bacterium]|nr:protein TolQ [Spongiibacteraceae bacterium]
MAQEFSVVQLVANASFTVQAVMLILLVASVASWYFIAQRVLYFRAARQELENFEQEFWSGIDLSQLFRQGNVKVEEGGVVTGVESIFRAGFKEFTRLRQQLAADPDAIMEGTQRAMRVATSREQERMEEGLPFLATVGSISPYIGLFGTVWGIMTAFQGLATVQQVTLQTVAPHISEALIATAMGLFAAIPAVVAYNRFASWVDNLLNKYDTFSDEFSAILHRQAHAGSNKRPS